MTESSVALPPETRGAAIPSYRIFTIGPDGHFTGVPKIAEFADDKEVVEEATRTANGADTEIWNLERLVVTLRGGLFLNKTAKRVSGASYSQNA